MPNGTKKISDSIVGLEERVKTVAPLLFVDNFFSIKCNMISRVKCAEKKVKSKNQQISIAPVFESIETEHCYF